MGIHTNNACRTENVCERMRSKKTRAAGREEQEDWSSRTLRRSKKTRAAGRERFSFSAGSIDNEDAVSGSGDESLCCQTVCRNKRGRGWFNIHMGSYE